MLGAIIGDVAGSNYEVLEVRYLKQFKGPRRYEDRIKILDSNEPLFTEESSCTDDSILTCAIYDAIINGNCDYEKYLRTYGLREINEGFDKYGRGRFGHGFVKWLNKEKDGDSYGNGAAMRISPVGYLFDSIEEVKENARLATIPSHNNEEAIKGAEAVAVSIFLLRKGMAKEAVIKYIKDNYYELDFDLEDLQRNYTFSSRTSNSVPQALYVFSQSNSFEDSIRKAISIGGDTDTIACIVGSLSEAYYGISDELKEQVKPYLINYMYDIIKKKSSNNRSRKIDMKNN
jgi:type I restriction enzyme M protein